MYTNKIMLLFLMCMIVQFITASENSSWKVAFFKGYVAGYKEKSPTTHAGFSEILQTSWEAAFPLAPARGDDAEVVVQVGEQVRFFVGIQDPSVQQEETEKCINGMRKAHSLLAQWVPESTKASFFINKFVEEWKKRTGRKERDQR